MRYTIIFSLTVLIQTDLYSNEKVLVKSIGEIVQYVQEAPLKLDDDGRPYVILKYRDSTFVALVDTCSSYTVIDNALADKCGIVAFSGVTQQARVFPSGTISLSQLDMKHPLHISRTSISYNIPIWKADLSWLKRPSGERISAVIGSDTLNYYSSIISYQDRKLYLVDPSDRYRNEYDGLWTARRVQRDGSWVEPSKTHNMTCAFSGNKLTLKYGDESRVFCYDVWSTGPGTTRRMSLKKPGDTGFLSPIHPSACKIVDNVLLLCIGTDDYPDNLTTSNSDGRILYEFQRCHGAVMAARTPATLHERDFYIYPYIGSLRLGQNADHVLMTDTDHGVPAVHCGLRDAGSALLLLDTGSSVTVLRRSSYATMSGDKLDGYDVLTSKGMIRLKSSASDTIALGNRVIRNSIVAYADILDGGDAGNRRVTIDGVLGGSTLLQIMPTISYYNNKVYYK